MSILCFDEIKKLRSTKEHNEIFVSDCEVAGTFVPNMSDADNKKWKAKHIKGSDERVEIRKSMSGTQVVIIVYKNITSKHDNIQISANGKIHMDLNIYNEFETAINEAKDILNLK